MISSKSLSTIALSGFIGLTGCNEDSQRRHQESRTLEKVRDAQLKLNAIMERGKLKSKGYEFICSNVLKRKVRDVFGKGNPGYEVGVIDDSFSFGKNDRFPDAIFLTSSERLRFTKNYALSILIDGGNAVVVSIGEEGGIIQDKFDCLH